MNKTKIAILKFCLEKKQHITVVDIAQVVNRSLVTVQAYLRDFKKAGRIAQFSTHGQYQVMTPKIYFENFLWVYKKNKLVGYLDFKGGVYRFAYRNHYLCEAMALPLSPQMALTEKIFYSQKIFPVFEQLIPEGQDRKMLEIKTGSSTDFDWLPLLQHVYGDLQFSKTSLTFEENEDFHPIRYTTIKKALLGENTFPNILEWEIEVDEKTLFPENQALDEAVHSFTPLGLSGLQHKFSVVLEGNCLREDKLADYVLKPYNPLGADPHCDEYCPHLALNEHLLMTFAKNELGFDVPFNGIIKRPIDREYHYVVKRFDRYEGYSFSCHELARVMGLNSKSQTSFEKLFKRFKIYIKHPKERLRLLQYYFYSLLVASEEWFLKNFSVMADEKTIRVAPLYNILMTGIYDNAFGYEGQLPSDEQASQIRLHDFYVLVDLMKVNRKRFNKAASLILFNYTHRLPEYIDKLEKVFSEASVYKKSEADLFSQEPHLSQSLSLAETLRKSHQIRMAELEKNGWYTQLDVPPIHVDYPVLQLRLFDGV
ncbi:MAG TPA: winged helix-turn-helix transcriptional regulator [Thiotrichaceae bacterium]|nr:winged helix-turn-helix transcriptional regulator [Thiotrichaceae bacterium]